MHSRTFILLEYAKLFGQWMLLWTVCMAAMAEEHIPLAMVHGSAGDYLLSRTIGNKESNVIVTQISGGKAVRSRRLFKGHEYPTHLRLALDEKGGLVVAATLISPEIEKPNEGVVVRLNHELSAERKFGSAGYVRFPLPGFSDDSIAAVSIRKNGSVLLTIHRAEPERPFETREITFVDLTRTGEIDLNSEFSDKRIERSVHFPESFRLEPQHLILGQDGILVSGVRTGGERRQQSPFAVEVDDVVRRVDVPSLEMIAGVFRFLENNRMIGVMPRGESETYVMGASSASAIPDFRLTVPTSLGTHPINRTHALGITSAGNSSLFGIDKKEPHQLRITEIGPDGEIRVRRTIPDLLDGRGNCRDAFFRFEE